MMNNAICELNDGLLRKVRVENMDYVGRIDCQERKGYYESISEIIVIKSNVALVFKKSHFVMK